MDRTVAVVPGLERSVLERVVRRVLDLEPSTMAVLVTGSYGRGSAASDSDLDLKVVTRDSPASPYRMWFEDRAGHQPLHVSPSVRQLDRFLAELAQPATWRWALGFPVRVNAQYAWAASDARALIGEPPSTVLAPAEPELEDFVEFLTKVRRSHALSDGIAVRHYAHYAALLAPGLLRTLNREVIVCDRRGAIQAALTLGVTPEHFPEDFATALGVTPAADPQVATSALRMGRELLAFLRTKNPNVDPQPDIAGYLIDGTLERHLGFIQ